MTRDALAGVSGDVGAWMTQAEAWKQKAVKAEAAWADTDEERIAWRAETLDLRAERDRLGTEVNRLTKGWHLERAELARYRAVVDAANELIERHGRFHPDFWARDRNCPECTFCFAALAALEEK
jgi:hypothetical protein